MNLARLKIAGISLGAFIIFVIFTIVLGTLSPNSSPEIICSSGVGQSVSYDTQGGKLPEDERERIQAIGNGFKAALKKSGRPDGDNVVIGFLANAMNEAWPGPEMGFARFEGDYAYSLDQKKEIAKSNDSIKKWAASRKPTQTGLGLIQWTPGVTKLVAYAEKEGKYWGDGQVQLDYLVGAFLDADGRARQGVELCATASGDQCARLIAHYLERCKHCRSLTDLQPEARAKNAHKIMGMNLRFEPVELGGSFVGGTSGDTCTGGSGSFLASGDIRELAYQVAWNKNDTPNPRSKAGASNNTSAARLKAKPAYVTLRDALVQRWPDGRADLYASCDRNTASIIKATIDPDLPWGPSQGLREYFNKTPKWERYTGPPENAPVGAVGIAVNKYNNRGSHTLLYIGEDEIYQGSIAGPVLVPYISSGYASLMKSGDGVFGGRRYEIYARTNVDPVNPENKFKLGGLNSSSGGSPYLGGVNN